MSERLSDESLTLIDDFSKEMMDGIRVTNVAEISIRGAMVSLIVSEVRARRAADLTSEDREALRMARNEVAFRRNQVLRSCDFPEEREAFRRALALLDRLLGGNHAGE